MNIISRMKKKSLKNKIRLITFYNGSRTITRYFKSVVIWSWNLVKRDLLHLSFNYFNFCFQYSIETPILLFVIEIPNKH